MFVVFVVAIVVVVGFVISVAELFKSKAPFTLAEILLATYWRPLATGGNK